MHRSGTSYPLNYTFRLLGAALAAGALAPGAGAGAEPVGTVDYRVSVGSLTGQRFHVDMAVRNKVTSAGGAGAADGPARDDVGFSIPVWSPGYYQILNFQKNVSNVTASDDRGDTLPVRKADDHTWRVLAPDGVVHLSYDLTAKDPGYGFFGSHLDDRTGFINGASALMYVVNGKELPDTIAYSLPPGWKLATPLDPETPAGVDAATSQPARYRADGYDELIDAPAQMGEFDRLDFDVRGTPFSAVLVGGQDVDRKALTDVLSRVAGAGISLFGYAPFNRYIFFIHFDPGNFGGGLEHRNSTVLNVWKQIGIDPRAGTDLFAHEYFHAWNVKRIHPAVLGPFDYTQKVRTGALWFAEGVTDYYAWVLPRMAGLCTPAEFRAEMAHRIHELQHTAARQRVSADEASRKAWEGASMGYGGMSYYLKGSLLGLLLDVKIRAATDGRRSLDDVMRLLDQQFGKTGRGYPEDGLLKAVNEVSGQNLSRFFARYVRGTDEIPWNSILRSAGLRYEEGDENLPYLGVSTDDDSTGPGVVVRSVTSGTAAEAAGIKTGDRILSIEGRTVDRDTFSQAVRALHPGERISIALGHSRETGRSPRTVTAKLGARHEPYSRLVPIPDADAHARRVLAGLLREGTAAQVGAVGVR